MLQAQYVSGMRERERERQWRRKKYSITRSDVKAAFLVFIRFSSEAEASLSILLYVIAFRSALTTTVVYMCVGAIFF